MTPSEHYDRFVDGFWTLLVDGLRLVGCGRSADRLAAWDSRE